MASFLIPPEPPYFIVENDNDKDAYQSISAHPGSLGLFGSVGYRDMSFEELRVRDYSAGRMPKKPHPATSLDSFVPTPHPVAGPVHCRKPIRASRDSTRKYVKTVRYYRGSH
jgi:hypothetical protein